MNKLIFGLVAFVYIVFIILNVIDNTNDMQHLLGVREGSIVVKSDIVSEKSAIKITTLSGPSIQVAHVNTNNPKQVILNGHQNKYLSLDHGLTWSEIEVSDRNNIHLATWINNTILVSTANSFDGNAFMASEDFGTSWKPVTIDTNSDELITLAEFTENTKPSWKSIPLSSLDEETLSNLYISLNRQGIPILVFSEKSKYYFELNDNILYIKEKYIKTNAQPKIYQDDIKFKHGEIPAGLSVSSDGLWAATRGGIFFQKQGDTNWQDKSALLGAHSFNGSFESQQKNKLLVLDAVGRLAISEDKGMSWKSLANQVSKAAFLHDESIVIAQQSGRVILVDGDDTVEITPNWKLILNENQYTTSFGHKYVYFIHGDKDNIWLTTGPLVYLKDNPIEISHYKAITKSTVSINELTVYHYNRNEKQWVAKPWSSANENEYTIKNKCEWSLDDNNIVSINGHRTSNYGTAEKVMLIQSGNTYVHFDDREMHIRTLKNCKPSGLKKVWDFDEIVNPAAYYETDEGLEIVALSYSDDNTIKRIKINLNNTPPLWRWFFYFFYYTYGIYIIGIGLIIWFLRIRKKSAKTQV